MAFSFACLDTQGFWMSWRCLAMGQNSTGDHRFWFLFPFTNRFFWVYPSLAVCHFMFVLHGAVFWNVTEWSPMLVLLLERGLTPQGVIGQLHHPTQRLFVSAKKHQGSQRPHQI